MFFDGELLSSVRILHGSENLGFRCCATPINMILMPKFAMYSVNWNESRARKLCTCKLFIQSILPATQAISIYLT